MASNEHSPGREKKKRNLFALGAGVLAIVFGAEFLHGFFHSN